MSSANKKLNPAPEQSQPQLSAELEGITITTNSESTENLEQSESSGSVETIEPVSSQEKAFIVGTLILELKILPPDELIAEFSAHLESDLIEIREKGWLDSSTVKLIADNLSQMLLGEDWDPENLNLINLAIEELRREAREPQSHEKSLDDDLRLEIISDDSNDEGEWGLAEIEDADVSEPIPDVPDVEEESHHEHIHQILEDELDSPSALLSEDDFTELEILKLSLISEGLLSYKVSDILFQDLLQESGSTVRKSRANGSSWWDTREAIMSVANSLANLLTGSAWPGNNPVNPEETGSGYIDNLRELAIIYPLDPEQVIAANGDTREAKFQIFLDDLEKRSAGLAPDSKLGTAKKASSKNEPTEEESITMVGTVTDRAKLLSSLTIAERLEFLKGELSNTEVEFSKSDLIGLSEDIEFQLGETPTKVLVEDVASLVFSEDNNPRLNNWPRKIIGETVVKLLLGIEDQYPERTTSPRIDFEGLRALIRTYRTEEMTEDDFIAHYDQSRWPAVGATVDLSIFTIIDSELKVLLIKRGNHPQKGKWALPGGFVNVTESLDEAATRELQEETSVDLRSGSYLEQVKTYGYPGRDRRGFIVSTLYAALIPEITAPVAGDDAAEAEFVSVNRALSGEIDLAFDHDTLIRDAYERISAKLEYSTIAMDFLPEETFSIEDLRRVYEIVWGMELIPSDFRRRIYEARGAISSVTPADPSNTRQVSLYRKGSAKTVFPPLDRKQIILAGEDY